MTASAAVLLRCRHNTKPATESLKPSLSRAAPSRHPEPETSSAPQYLAVPAAPRAGAPSTSQQSAISEPLTSAPRGAPLSACASPAHPAPRSPFRKLFVEDGARPADAPTGAVPVGLAATNVTMDDLVAANRRRLFISPGDAAGHEASGVTAALATALSSGSTSTVTPAAAAANSVLLVWRPSFLDDDEAFPTAPPTSACSTARSIAHVPTLPQSSVQAAAPPSPVAPTCIVAAAAAASPYKLARRASVHTPQGPHTRLPGGGGLGPGPSSAVHYSVHRGGIASASASRVQSPYRKLFADSEGDSSDGVHSRPSGLRPVGHCAQGAIGTPSKPWCSPQISALASAHAGDAQPSAAALTLNAEQAAPPASVPVIVTAAATSVLEKWGSAEPAGLCTQGTAPNPAPMPASAVSVPMTSVGSGSLPVVCASTDAGRGSASGTDVLRSRGSVPAPSSTGLEGLEHLIKPLKLPLTPRSSAAEAAAEAAREPALGGSASSAQSQAQAQDGAGVPNQAFSQQVTVLAPVWAPLPAAPLVRYNSLQQQAVTRAGWAALQQQQQQQVSQQQVPLQHGATAAQQAADKVLPAEQQPQAQHSVQVNLPGGKAMDATSNPLFQELAKIKDQLKVSHG